MTARWVLRADLDAFFASAEVFRRPGLSGKPLVVGGSPAARGVVAPASSEASAVGVCRAIPLARDRRRRPGATVLRGDFPRYEQLSSRVRALLEEASASLHRGRVDGRGLRIGMLGLDRV